jgi:hypothetical protein
MLITFSYYLRNLSTSWASSLYMLDCGAFGSLTLSASAYEVPLSRICFPLFLSPGSSGGDCSFSSMTLSHHTQFQRHYQNSLGLHHHLLLLFILLCSLYCLLLLSLFLLLPLLLLVLHHLIFLLI